MLEKFLRTRSYRRSAQATFSASHTPSLAASAVVHTRKIRCVRIWLRWYSIVEPDHS